MKSEKPRSCGPCTACCYSLGVTALPKDEFVPCDYLKCRERPDSACGGSQAAQLLELLELRTQGGGCRIYDSKPEACTDYKCMWLYGEIPGEDARPDLLGVVFTAARSEVLGEYVQVTEVIGGAVEMPFVAKFVNLIAENHAVLWLQKTKRTLLAAPKPVRDKVEQILRAQQTATKTS